MSTRDGYSNFSFLKAITPQDLDGSAFDGATIDMTGFETATFILYAGNLTSAGAMSADNLHAFILEHADASSGDNPDTMVIVDSTVVIRDNSAAMVSGVVFSIDSFTGGSTIYQVGYKGRKRFVRLGGSGVGSPSIMSACAIAILGQPHNWPVNTVG